MILGSIGRDLIKQSSETLAGRIAYLELRGFSLPEVCLDAHDVRKRWLRGGFPRSYLAEDETHSFSWREQFIQTFLERDIPSWAYAFRRRHCTGSGPCCRITMGKS